VALRSLAAWSRFVVGLLQPDALARFAHLVGLNALIPPSSIAAAMLIGCVLYAHRRAWCVIRSA